MSRRTLLRFVFFALAHALPWSSPLCAQLSKQENGCPPTPASAPAPQIAIDSVEFSGETEIPRELRTKLADVIQHYVFNPRTDFNTNWLDDLKEVRIKSFLQDKGFFRASVEANSGLIRAEPHRLHYWVSVEVNLGPQYHLGRVEFENAAEFSYSVLRTVVALNEGELLDVSRIRDGLDAIHKLYGSHGYVDALFEAQTKIEESDHRVDLLIKVAPGVRYRVRRLDIRGLNADAENFLRSKLEPGQVFDSAAWGELFEKNDRRLPLDLLPAKDVGIRRDLKDGVVDIFIDYQPCRKESSLPAKLL